MNDRWGYDSRCKHGGFLSCDDRYNPGNIISNTIVQFIFLLRAITVYESAKMSTNLHFNPIFSFKSKIGNGSVQDLICFRVFKRTVLELEISCDNTTCKQEVEVQSSMAIKSDSLQGVFMFFLDT